MAKIRSQAPHSHRGPSPFPPSSLPQSSAFISKRFLHLRNMTSVNSKLNIVMVETEKEKEARAIRGVDGAVNLRGKVYAKRVYGSIPRIDFPFLLPIQKGKGPSNTSSKGTGKGKSPGPPYHLWCSWLFLLYYILVFAHVPSTYSGVSDASFGCCFVAQRSQTCPFCTLPVACTK